LQHVLNVAPGRSAPRNIRNILQQVPMLRDGRHSRCNIRNILQHRPNVAGMKSTT